MILRTRARRSTLALTTLAICAALFHSQVATALVTRGDEFLVRGEVGRARIYYRRALAFDPMAGVATDRIALSALEGGSPESLRDASSIAGAYLAHDPRDRAVLLDRALLERRLHDDAAAARDFGSLANVDRDRRYARLAASSRARAKLEGPDR